MYRRHCTAPRPISSIKGPCTTVPSSTHVPRLSDQNALRQTGPGIYRRQPFSAKQKLRATLIANSFLESEIERLSEAMSAGFARGKIRRRPTPEKKAG